MCHKQIKINIQNNEIICLTDSDIETKLTDIQNKLVLNHGKFYDEYPEQRISVRYLTGNEKVLEIGGNIGRNSLIISSILKDSSNLVVLECNKEIAEQIIEMERKHDILIKILKDIASGHPEIREEIMKRLSEIQTEVIVIDND